MDLMDLMDVGIKDWFCVCETIQIFAFYNNTNPFVRQQARLAQLVRALHS